MKTLISLLILSLFLVSCSKENEVLEVKEEKINEIIQEEVVEEEFIQEFEEKKEAEIEKIEVSFEVKELVDFDNCIIDKERFEVLKENTDIFNYDDFCIKKYELTGTIKYGEPDEIIVKSCGKDNPYTLQQFNKGDETFVYNISKNNGNLCEDYEFSYFLEGKKLGNKSYLLENDRSVEYVFEGGEMAGINNIKIKGIPSYIQKINLNYFILIDSKGSESIVYNINKNNVNIFNFNINNLTNNKFNKIINNEVNNIGYGYYDIENLLYYQGQLLENVDISTFKVIHCSNPIAGMNLCITKDKNHVYFTNKKINGADVNTFKILNENGPFYIDKNHVYLYGDIIEGIESKTFEFISNKSYLYFKYANNMYIFNYKSEFDITFNFIKEADLNTFEVINILYAKDKNYVYKNGEILEGVDPATFEISE